MKASKIKKKILLDIRIFVINIPLLIFGWFSSQYVSEPLFDVPDVIHILSMLFSTLISIYLILSWLFYDKLYN